MTAEGAEQDLFGIVSQTENTPEQATLPPTLTAKTDADIARFLAMSLMVDDGNMPAPENIPQPQAITTEDVEWDSNVCCHRSNCNL